MVLGRKTDFFLGKKGFGVKNQLLPRKKMVLGRKTNFFPRENMVLGKEDQLYPRQNQNKPSFLDFGRIVAKRWFFGVILVFTRKNLVFLPKIMFFPMRKLVFHAKTILFLGRSCFPVQNHFSRENQTKKSFWSLAA